MESTIGRFVMAGTAALALAGCEDNVFAPFYGYAEGEYVLVASPYAGQLETLAVARGEQVEAGAVLFALEQASEAAGKREAEERLRIAQAKLDNLRKGLRPAELEALNAQAAQVEASRALSAAQLERDNRLFAQGFISHARLDEARSNLERDQARLDQIRAQIRLASQGIGRTGEINAARAEVDAARAGLQQAQWRLEQKAARAPAAALVHDTFYTQGEWVPAGKPVVSLLPPGNIKLRFFVPESEVGRIRLGQPLAVTCDGCGAPIPAQVSYVSTQPEYTPPVIYSRESRAKLVFMVEARPAGEQATRLRPGQPVDVATVGS